MNDDDKRKIFHGLNKQIDTWVDKITTNSDRKTRTKWLKVRRSPRFDEKEIYYEDDKHEINVKPVFKL